MRKNQIVKYYCAEHSWCLANPCLVCGKETKELILPARRNDLYYLRGVDRPLPSATSVLKVLAKPGLENWFKSQAAGLAFANPSWSVRDVIAQMGKNLGAAARRGERAHEIISQGAPDEKYEPEIMPYITAYRKFCVAFPHTVEYREKIVYSDTYAGRTDALLRMKNNDLVLVDWKTNNSGLFKETGIQLSLYKHAKFLEPEAGQPGIPIDWSGVRLMGVHVGPDGNFATQEYEDSYEIAEACIKIHQWSTTT